MKKLFFSIFFLWLAVATFAQNDSVALREVVVTGTRSATDVRYLPMTVSVVDRRQLTEQHRQSILPALLEEVPGFFVTSRGMMGYGVSTGAAGGMSMRGLSGGAAQMLVLIDGHPQYQGVFGHPVSDSYQTLMAERVEVLRGPASMLYGSNAMGGVVNIVTRKMRQDGVQTHLGFGAGSYGSIQAEAASQVRCRRFSSTVAAQYSRTDNHRPDMGFEQFGGYLKLGYDFSKHWNAFADLDLTHFNASNPGTVSSPMLENDQWITRGAASLVVENHYGNTSGALSVYDNFGWHKINDGHAVGAPAQTDLFRSKDAVAGVSVYQSASLFRGNRITAGFDYQHIYGRAYYTNRQTGDIVVAGRRKMQSAHAHENEVAGYVDFRQDLTSWLTLDAGIRYDHHSTAGDEWIPQMGLVWRPVAAGELKAMVSKGFRNPTNKDMYLYGTANHDSLHAERLWNYELAWKGRLADCFDYGVNLFYLKADNLIQTVAGRNINTGELENSGVELEANWRVNPHWTVSSNHSLLHMRNHVVGAPEYKGYLGARFNCSRWSVLAALQYLGSLYTQVGTVEQKENVCLLNTTVNYQLTKNVQLWGRGENLLARRYELYLGYPMPRATFMAGVNVRL